MNSLDIIIEANREDEEPWRFNRIQRVLGYAQALADLQDQEEFYKKVYSMFDYKGTLTIVWKLEPTDQEKTWFQQAWNSSVTLYEGNIIEHRMREI